MELRLPGDDDPRRRAVREWLDAHQSPSGRTLAEAGYVAPHWPRPWGLEADPVHQLIIDEELRRAGVRRPQNQIGIGWAGPTILHAGTRAQKDRYLMPLLAGEEIWCQLFSEPDAGSDLAGLRTRATRADGVYVVHGEKIWTSVARQASFGILLARTDPDAPPRQGISYFICPMDAPGVTVRPIREMTGAEMFNEVFLEGVELPGEDLVGEENRGWDLARVTLANERVSLSEGGVLWGRGPTARDLLGLARTHGPITDSALRHRVIEAWAEGELLRRLGSRILTARLEGRQPGPEASVRKALGDLHGQKVMNLARDLAGARGLIDVAGPLGADDPMWSYGFLFAPALTIGGGTSEVQRDIIAERVLGLPRI